VEITHELGFDPENEYFETGQKSLNCGTRTTNFVTLLLLFYI